MKLLVSLLVLITFSNLFAKVECYENYYWVSNNFIISEDDCSSKVAVCVKKQNLEGWYSYEVQTERFIRYANCGTSLELAPVCLYKGTLSEGWYMGSRKIKSLCAGEDMACSYIGSRSEGWYSYASETKSLISYAKCL